MLNFRSSSRTRRFPGHQNGLWFVFYGTCWVDITWVFLIVTSIYTFAGEDTSFVLWLLSSGRDRQIVCMIALYFEGKKEKRQTNGHALQRVGGCTSALLHNISYSSVRLQAQLPRRLKTVMKENCRLQPNKLYLLLLNDKIKPNFFLIHWGTHRSLIFMLYCLREDFFDVFLP